MLKTASGVRPTDVSGTDAQKKHLKMTRTARGAARDDDARRRRCRAALRDARLGDATAGAR